ncbi:MAG: Fe-S cluster assembly protein SufD [Gammaproteobacteria bacterium]
MSVALSGSRERTPPLRSVVEAGKGAERAASDSFAEELRRIEDRLSGAGLAWLRELRRQALESLQATGLPGLRDEDWKYTNVAAIARQAWTCALPGERSGPVPPALDLGPDAHALRFVDGHYQGPCAAAAPLPAGIDIQPLARTLEHGRPDLRAHIERHALRPAHPFVALNAVFLNDGVWIEVAAGVRVTAPVHLQFNTSQCELPVARYPRVYVHLAQGAELTLVESYTGAAGARALCCPLTEVLAGPGARLDHYVVQQGGAEDYHVGSLLVRQLRDSSVRVHSVSLGGALARHDIHVELAEAGASLILNGLYVGAGRHHIDYHTRIDHLAEHTDSEERFKGVLNGYARGVFNGKVIVHPAAQKTRARQSNHNLLLSEHAEADTKPELQIHADDVQCSHGATVGQLDETAVYYLRSRGIDLTLARAMLTYAFAADVVDGVRVDALQRYLGDQIGGRLPALGAAGRGP